MEFEVEYPFPEVDDFFSVTTEFMNKADMATVGVTIDEVSLLFSMLSIVQSYYSVAMPVERDGEVISINDARWSYAERLLGCELVSRR